MKRPTMLLVMLLSSALLFITVGSSAEQEAEKAARKAAEAWLALVDSSDYSASWDEAAEIFKSRVEKEQWDKTARAVRGPLGKVKSRNFAIATYTKQLPGVPDGEYVVVQYETSFENKQSAVETITPMLEKDGKWRVSGYFIK